MKSPKKYILWLYRHSKGVRGSIAACIALGLLNVAMNLLFIYICKRIVDIATGTISGNIVLWAVLMAVTGLSRILTTAFGSRIENLAVNRMTFLIRSSIYNDILQSRWNGMEKFHSGDTLNRLETDTSTVTSVICSDIPVIVRTLTQLVAAAIFLFILDWTLAVALIVITPFFILLSKVFVFRVRRITRGIRDTESRVQSHLQESIQNRVTVRTMEYENEMFGRLNSLQGEEYDLVKQRTNISIFARVLVGCTFWIGYLAAFLRGAFGILYGTTTYGMMTAFLQLVGQIQRPAVDLTRQIPGLIYATSSIDRLMELEEAPKEEQLEPRRLNAPMGVRLKGLSFAYPDSERAVLEGLDYDFKPLSKTAIVGETGAGKSTLVRLILALLHPSDGMVEFYDGEDCVEASSATRCNIAYVPQGNSLFSGTIRENLRMGDPAADEERMFEVLDMAQAGFVRELPLGLDSPCGEGGQGLSEGQAQRIAIARGLLRQGDVLLLDEFSSSLDPQTEEQLVRALNEKVHDKTMIFVTHREKIATICDNTLRITRL